MYTGREHSLFHGESLFVIASRYAEYVILPFITESVGGHFGAETLLVEDTELVLVDYFKQLLTTRCRVRHVQLKIIKMLLSKP